MDALLASTCDPFLSLQRETGKMLRAMERGLKLRGFHNVQVALARTVERR